MTKTPLAGGTSCSCASFAARWQQAAFVARSCWNMLSPGAQAMLWDQFPIEAQGVLDRRIAAYLVLRERPGVTVEPFDGGRLWRVNQHGYARTITAAELIVAAGLEDEDFGHRSAW